MSKTVKINVIAPFTFIKPDHAQEKYTPGIYEVEKEFADHWFVQAHTGAHEVQQPVVNDAGATSNAGAAPGVE